MRKLNLHNWFKVPLDRLSSNKFCRWGLVGHSVAIVLLSFLLSHFIIYDIEHISAFASSNSSGDFEISDIYNAVADRRQVSVASPYVTVVSVDECSRQEVLDVLEMIAEYNPKVIGLDILFSNTVDDEDIVTNTIQSIPNLVLPCIVSQDDCGEWKRLPHSFIDNIADANYAYVNLNALSTQNVVRDFTPFRVTSCGDTISHISVEMSKLYDVAKYNTLIRRNNEVEIVKYSSVDIPIISAQEIMQSGDSDYLSRYICNRAVFVGDINNLNDKYLTPIDGLMPGVLIHAYSLNTILMDLYTDVSPNWLNWLIAIMVCMLFICSNIIIRNRWNNIGNLVMRILQVALIFGMVLLGTYWYNNHLQYVDFSPIVLMLGFSSLADDIYWGCFAVYLKIKQFKR